MSHLAQLALAFVACAFTETNFGVSRELPAVLALFCAVPHSLALAVRRSADAGSYRLANVGLGILEWSPAWLYATGVAGLGWCATVERWSGARIALLEWPHPAVFLALMPFAVLSLIACDARARAVERHVALVAAVRHFQVRMFLSSAIPMAVFLLAVCLVGRVPALRANIEEVGLWSAVFAAVLAVGLVLVLPWIVLHTWDTVPLPRGGLRDPLESLASRARLRYRDLRVWRTGHLVANAAILGVIPSQRVVLFSDALLEHLTPGELAAVLGHEIGHARRHHLLVFATWTAVFLLASDLAMAFAPLQNGTAIAAVGLVAAALWFAAFGYLSRRFELDADLESLELLGSAEGLISALEKVGGPHSDARASWRHFSVRDRVAFLRDVERRPEVGRNLRRRLRRWTVLGIAAGALLVALQAVALFGSLDEDRIRVALRLGCYDSAARSIENGGDFPEDLKKIAILARDLAHGSGAIGPPELESAARRALDAGDAQAAEGYFELAVLRGRSDLEGARYIARLLAEGRIAEADIEVERLAPELRAAVQAWRLGSTGDPAR